MSFNFKEEIYRGCTVRIEAEEDTSSFDPRQDDNVGTMVCWHRRYTLGDEQPDKSPAEYLTGLAPYKLFQSLEERERRGYNNRSIYGYREGRLSSETYDALAARWESAREKLVEKWLEENVVILDLYLYDHSGITMSTGSFSCPWDSGRVGLIYCTLEKAQYEWGTEDSKVKGWAGEASYSLKEDGSKHTLREAAIDYMEGEVQTYDDYLTGDIGRLIVEDPDGEEIESCGGFFPDHGVDYGKQWEDPMSEGRSRVDDWCKEQEEEKDEADYWAARDVETV